MNSSNLLYQRLHNQQITSHQFKKPGELVSWLGAVQAQDYAAGKWALGLRLPAAKDATIEQAIEDKSIIRTWSLRGTLHFMPPQDIRWILQLLAQRLYTVHAGVYRKQGIDKTVLKKSRTIIELALRDNKKLTRKELAALFKKKGISTEGINPGLILLRAALDGLICFGPMRGKEFTHVLLDEWIPPAKALTQDEALTELTKRYFNSHGPATIYDFAWWSGLTVADIKRGLEMAASNFNKEVINGQEYWMPRNTLSNIKKSKLAFLLPNFDEYLVGYKNRADAVDDAYAKQMSRAGNGIFSPVIVIKGKVTGTWQRSFKKEQVVIKTTPFYKHSEAEHNSMLNAAKQYSKFMDMPLHKV